MKIAEAGELELEADFDATANEAYELIVVSDGSISKRGLWQDCKCI